MSNEKNEIIKAGLEIYKRRLVEGTGGNISRRIEEDPNKFAITPSSMKYEEIDESDIVTVNLEGETVEGKRKPSSEVTLHRLTYKAREDVNAIIHTHSTYASAISCTKKGLPPILIETVLSVGGKIKTSKFEPPGTRELADTAIETLNDKKAALLANHGVLVVGQDMEEAVNLAIMVEKSAKVYILSSLFGNPQKFNPEEVEKLREHFKNNSQSQS